MNAGAVAKIRLAVIGLGPTWRDRFRPAVLEATSRLRVVAVNDQVARRAEIEAAALRASVVASLVALMSRPDIDAVALLDPQWYGPHALELAARAGKPVLLGTPLPTDPGALDRLDDLVGTGGATVLVVGGIPAERVPQVLGALERSIRGEVPGPAVASWADAVLAARRDSAPAAS